MNDLEPHLAAALSLHMAPESTNETSGSAVTQVRRATSRAKPVFSHEHGLLP